MLDVNALHNILHTESDQLADFITPFVADYLENCIVDEAYIRAISANNDKIEFFIDYHVNKDFWGSISLNEQDFMASGLAD